MFAQAILSVASTTLFSGVNVVDLIVAFFVTGLLVQSLEASTGNSTNDTCSFCNDSKHASFNLRCQ